MNWKKLIVVVVFVGLMLPMVGQVQTVAGQAEEAMNCHQRPLSDFLDAQGTNVTFFAPVRDELGWLDGGFTTFALIDYAGFADAYITETTGESLGTNITGRILECPEADGRAKISVVLQTSNALGFAQAIQDIIDNDFDFGGTATIFGNKAVDVAAGAPAAVGPASLRLTFMIDAVGAPLPDWIALEGNVGAYTPYTTDFRSTTVGTLPDGTRSRLRVQQVGFAELGDEAVTYTREIVDFSRE